MVLKREIILIKNPDEILKHLDLGINIPVWPEFKKYILFDLKEFNAQSLLLVEDRKPVGHVLVFYSDRNTLYFGFFGVFNHSREKIEFLIEKLKKFARENGFEALNGPVNIPTIIYGWGFMEEGSSTKLFAHKPVNSPIYSDIFRQKGFREILKEESFEGVFSNVPPEYLNGCNFEEYELVVFDTWEQFADIKVEFLLLNSRNLPPRSVVTPNSAAVYDNYLEFIMHYGDPSMMVFAFLKKTKRLIGCFVGTPNPFDKNSFVLYTIVLDKEHRSHGLGWLMVEKLFRNSLKRGINYCTTFVGTHVDSSREMSLKMGLRVLRTHTVFSFAL